MNNIFLYGTIILLFIINIIILIYIFYKFKNQIISKIKDSIEPKFLEIAISPDSNKIINLAIDIWRLEEKINLVNTFSEVEKEKVNNSVNRLKKYIKESDIEIKGFNGEKYSEDINIFELKGIEETQDKGLDNQIKNTIEPAVIINGKIIKQAKVIIYKFKS